MGQMHVVSWNVAGLRTTYGKLKSRTGGLLGLMDKLRIDILCLQEAKLSEQQLTFDDYEQRADLDCFFSWAAKKSGANGVATIARKGLTVRATRVLDGGVHDAAGRFLQTDHGAFVLINLYVHNDGPNGAMVSAKMDFLLRVRERVRSLRAAGRKVIVLGDLNLKLRGQDGMADVRSVSLEGLRASLPVDGEPEVIAKVRDQLKSHENWSEFCSRIVNMTSAPSRNRFVYRLEGKSLEMDAIESPDVEMFKMAGSTAAVADHSLLCDADSKALDSSGANWVARANKSLPLCYLIAALSRVFDWPTMPEKDAIRAMADWPCSWISAGRMCSSVFAQNLIAYDGLVDSFCAFHSAAVDRFTCWDQSRNQRYVNEGGRLDYILVDAAIELLRGEVPLYGCEVCGKQGSQTCRCTVTSRESAIRGATAHGLWRPAPIDGSGLAEGSDEAYASMIRPPHTGIIYTPPDWSDHVAVSALLNLPKAPLMKLEFDVATRECQPHLKQRKIVDLFSKAAARGSNASIASDPEVSSFKEEVAVAAASKKQKTASAQSAEKFKAFFGKQK